MTLSNSTIPASLWEDPFDHGTRWGRYWTVIAAPLPIRGWLTAEQLARARASSGGRTVCEWCREAEATWLHRRSPHVAGNAANLLNTCPACSRRLARNPILARNNGWLLRADVDPARRPFRNAEDLLHQDGRYQHTLRFLDSRGGVYEARNPDLRWAIKRWAGPGEGRPNPADRVADDDYAVGEQMGFAI